MKVKVLWDDSRVIVERESTDPKYYRESLLWRHIARKFQERKKVNGDMHDVIKKPMWKDGHLVSEHEYYIRHRTWDFAITDDHALIRPLYEDFNAGELTLRIHKW